MIFEFDRWVQDKPYPNLARWQAEPYTPAWRQFSHHWPFSEPVMLYEYLQDENLLTSTAAQPIYPVAVSFFDFSVDWISLLPAARLQSLRDGRLLLLFYYSEGDNPQRIWHHLVAQLGAAGIGQDRLRLISANSSADSLDHGIWFADDEMLYRKRNRKCQPVAIHHGPRSRLFTALVRTHKWWRATVMADFWRRGWHELGYFSYDPSITVGDLETDNPIEVDRFPRLRGITHDFLQHKFAADDLSSDEHNDHHLLMPQHYHDSYLNIVLETHMDADQSGGVFLTEKTFKPIKHAQPFVIFGAANSLARLRDLGYKTFDHALDNSYDAIQDTTARYSALMAMLEDVICRGNLGLHDLYDRCVPDIEHNQRHFLADKKHRLNNVLERL